MTSPRLWRSSPTLEGCSIWWLKDYELQMQIWSQSFALLYYYMISSHGLCAFGQLFICEYWLVIWTKMDLSWAPSNRPDPNGSMVPGGSLWGLGKSKVVSPVEMPPRKGRKLSHPVLLGQRLPSQSGHRASAKGGALQKAPGAWVNWQMIHMDFQGWTFEGPESRYTVYTF